MTGRGVRQGAIIFTDIVGYGSLAHANEPLALELLSKQREVLAQASIHHQGQGTKLAVDKETSLGLKGWLRGAGMKEKGGVKPSYSILIFENPLNAVRCAVEVQRGLRQHNKSVPNDKELITGIGIDAGEFELRGDDVFGEPLGMASRIWDKAGPSGICITNRVAEQVRGDLKEDLVRLDTGVAETNGDGLYKVDFQTEALEGIRRVASRNRIAVLPFTSLSPDPGDEYFSDGMTEEVISTISKINGIDVISRTSVMLYKKTPKPVKELSIELDVGTVLEGSVRKAGNRLRVTVQMIDAQRDSHLWVNSYDREIQDIFAIQTDIAEHVAGALKVQLLSRERQSLERKPTESTHAYSLYLRGRFHFSKRTIEEVKRAVGFFEEAVKEDPKFALGYVGLADCYMILSSNFGIDNAGNLERAKRTLATALELDEFLPEAHASQGLVLMRYSYNFKEAEEELRKAIELKPSYASAHHWLCLVLRGKGRTDEALLQITKALELDPFSPILNFNHALIYVDFRDYTKALEICKKAAELDPGFPDIHFLMFDIYSLMQRFNEANREAGIVIELLKNFYPDVAKEIEATSARFKGDKDTVRRLLPDLEALVEKGPGPDAFLIAGLYFFLGDRDKGFEWLERSISRLEFGPTVLRVDEMFDDVRSDPRYQKLVKRLGLE